MRDSNKCKIVKTYIYIQVDRSHVGMLNRLRKK